MMQSVQEYAKEQLWELLGVDGSAGRHVNEDWHRFLTAEGVAAGEIGERKLNYATANGFDGATAAGAAAWLDDLLARMRGGAAVDFRFADTGTGTDLKGNAALSCTRSGATATRINPQGQLETVAANTLRLDYDPVTLACKGLLVEEARTNSIRNNTMVGSVAGTPGTMPTNWAVAGNSGLSRQVVGSGVEDGISYVDVRFFGTTAAVATPENYINFESGTAIAAASGQIWTSSFFVRIVGGTTAGVVNWENYVLGYDNVASLSEASSNGFAITATELRNSRNTYTRTLSSANTVYVQSRLDINFTAGGGSAVDITLRIGMPQLEQGAFATSVIPTSAGAVTRNADIITTTLSPAWFNPDAGAVIMEAYGAPQVGGTRRFADFRSTDNVNALVLGYASSASVRLLCLADGGVSQADITAAASPSAGPVRVGASFKANDFRICAEGASGGQDISGNLPVMTKVNIGSYAGADAQYMLNGYIKNFTYYPAALPDLALKLLTR